MLSNQLTKVTKKKSGIHFSILEKFQDHRVLQSLIQRSQPLVNKYKDISTKDIQQNVINFYHPNSVAPFLPVAAQGPWIVGSRGEIIYDVGGYGMLSFGHNPEWSTQVLLQPQIMANVMTPNVIQQQMTETLQKHIGINREGRCPYSHFAFLNSGSEAMELALRICDLSKEEKPSAFVVIQKGFHGRTGQASRISDSCLPKYRKYLKSFQNPHPVIPIEMNNRSECLSIIRSVSHQYHIEAVIAEPIMGEGDPGNMMSLQFYRLLRRLTKKYKSKLIIDSVQAGIRGTGFLSATDYFHLRREDPPDMEIFSKAINGGQYPLSVLAATPEIYEQFQPGIYGNTMTANPRALSIGIETLNQVTPKISTNIVKMGEQFQRMLTGLQKKYPEIVSHVSGRGLLQALHIHPDYPVDQYGGLEYQCRMNGLNVIHGGDNALRFTPYFEINKQEIELIRDILDLTLQDFQQAEILGSQDYFN